jgi:hypothetical protein
MLILTALPNRAKKPTSMAYDITLDGKNRLIAESMLRDYDNALNQ